MSMSRRLRETVLWVGAVLGVLCIGWTVAMFAFGLTPLVFTSGSMSPAIGAGDLAFSRTIDAKQVEVGDIVSVVNDKGVRITHRVVRADPTQEGAVLTLQGDANHEPDAEPYAVTSVERVSFSVPKAGYVVRAVSSPVGMFAGGLLAASALFLAFGRRGDSSTGSGDPTGRPSPDETPDSGEVEEHGGLGRGMALATGAAALALLGTLAPVHATQAAFTNAATLTSGTLNTTMVAPGAITCTGGGLFVATIVLRWTHVDPRYDYRVVTRNENGGTVTTTDVVGSGTAGQTQQSVTITRSSGVGFGSYDLTATVQSKAKGSATWLSAGSVYEYREGRIFAGSSVYCT